MISEAILRLFCRPFEVASLNPSTAEWTIETALTKADRVFPDFRQRIRGKVVLDYGSGQGFQAAAMALAGAKHVIALDPWDRAVTMANQLVAKHGLGDRVSVIADPSEVRGEADIVLSQNSFEHFPDPERELRAMASLLSPGGKLFICFGPPWYAPHGSHMSFFCRLPWVNVVFPEKAVMKVRSAYRNDGAVRYTDVPGGLNRMEQLVVESGLKVEYSKYHAVKNIDVLAAIPVLRELLINDVTAILVKLA
jgi:SAM-dependent methyltransferase